MYAFRLRRKISSKHLLSRKGVHFHRKNRFSHNKKTNHRKNRFSHKKKTNLRLLDTPNELITLLYRTSSHTTISLTPVKIYPSSVNEMHLNFSFFNDISIVSSSFRAGVLAFHGTWHLLFFSTNVVGYYMKKCIMRNKSNIKYAFTRNQQHNIYIYIYPPRYIRTSSSSCTFFF